MALTGIAAGMRAAREDKYRAAAQQMQLMQIAEQAQARRQALIDRENYRNALQQFSRGGGGGDLGALATSVLPHVPPEQAGGLMKLMAELEQQRRTQAQDQDRARALRGLVQPAGPQAALPSELSFLPPQDRAAIASDMARSPGAPASFVGQGPLAGQAAPLTLTRPREPLAGLDPRIVELALAQDRSGKTLSDLLIKQSLDGGAPTEVGMGIDPQGRPLFQKGVVRGGAFVPLEGTQPYLKPEGVNVITGGLTPAVKDGRPVFLEHLRGGGVQEVPGVEPPAGAARGAAGKSFAKMTPEEVTAEGLPPGTVAYRDESGLPKVLFRPTGQVIVGYDAEGKAIFGNQSDVMAPGLKLRLQEKATRAEQGLREATTLLEQIKKGDVGWSAFGVPGTAQRAWNIVGPQVGLPGANKTDIDFMKRLRLMNEYLRPILSDEKGNLNIRDQERIAQLQAQVGTVSSVPDAVAALEAIIQTIGERKAFFDDTLGRGNAAIPPRQNEVPRQKSLQEMTPQELLELRTKMRAPR